MVVPESGGELSAALVNAVLLALWAALPGLILGYIRQDAERGLYDIRGLGAKRKLPTFDDLTFLPASASRYPLEGYRERCATDVHLGTRFAKKPIQLKIPVTIAGMSFGALSAQAKEALQRTSGLAPPTQTEGTS